MFKQNTMLQKRKKSKSELDWLRMDHAMIKLNVKIVQWGALGAGLAFRRSISQGRSNLLTIKFGKISKFQMLKWPYLVFFGVLLTCISAIIKFDASCSLCAFTVDVPLIGKSDCWFGHTLTKCVKNTVVRVTF